MTKSRPTRSSAAGQSPSPSTLIALALSGDEDDEADASDSDEYRPRTSASSQRPKYTSKRARRRDREESDASTKDGSEDDEGSSESEEPTSSIANGVGQRTRRSCRRASWKESEEDDDEKPADSKKNGIGQRPKRSCRRAIWKASDEEAVGSSDDNEQPRPSASRRSSRVATAKDDADESLRNPTTRRTKSLARASDEESKRSDQGSNVKANRRRRRTAAKSSGDENETTESGENEPPPRPKRARRKPAAIKSSDDGSNSSEAAEELQKTKRRCTRLQPLCATPTAIGRRKSLSTSPQQPSETKKFVAKKTGAKPRNALKPLKNDIKQEPEDGDDEKQMVEASASAKAFLNLKDLDPTSDDKGEEENLPETEPSVDDISNPFYVDEPNSYQDRMRDAIDIYRFMELPDFGGFSRRPIHKSFLNRNLWYLRKEAYKSGNQHRTPTSADRRSHIRKWADCSPTNSSVVSRTGSRIDAIATKLLTKAWILLATSEQGNGFLTPPPRNSQRRPSDKNASFTTNSTRSTGSLRSRSSLRSPRLKPHRRSHLRVPPTIDFHYLRNNLALGGKPAVIQCFLTSDMDGKYSALKKIPSATFNMDVNVKYNHLEIDMPEDFCTELSYASQGRDDYLVVQVTFRYEEVEVGEGRKLRNVPARQASQCERAAQCQQSSNQMSKTAEQHTMFGALLVSSLSATEGAEVQSGETTVVLCPTEELQISDDDEESWKHDQKLVPRILDLSQKASPRKGIEEEYPCLRLEVQDGGADMESESSDSESFRPTTDDEKVRPTSSLATGPSGCGPKKGTNSIDILVGAAFPERFALQFQMYGAIDEDEPQRAKSIADMQHGRTQHRPSIIAAIGDSDDSESTLSTISDSDEESLASTVPVLDTPSRALRKTPARITSGVVIKKEELLEALESREPSPPTPPPAPQQRYVARMMNTTSRCFFCLSRSLRFPNMYAFLKHLMLCHARLNFEYKSKIPVSKGRTLGGLAVTLNTDYDGSHEFDAMFHYVSNNTSRVRRPKWRLPSEPIYLVPRGSARHMRSWWTAYSVELLEYDKALPQHVCFGDGTRHLARFCFDQPTKINHKWMQQQTTKNLADITDLHYTERTFMCLWNKFLAEVRITHLAHGMLYKAHRVFIKAYSDALQRNCLNAQWVCHLTVLQKEGQLTPHEWYDLVRRAEPGFDPRSNPHHYVTRELHNLEKERWIAQQGGRDKLKSAKASIDELWASAEHTRWDAVDPTVIQSMDDLRRLYPFASVKQLDEIWKYLEDYSANDFTIQMPS